MHQLHKENRNFVYYVRLLPWYKRPFSSLINNGRPFVIYMNMKKEATNKDQLAAYYYARLLDAELMQMFEGKEGPSYDLI